jgi:hypothetical protein
MNRGPDRDDAVRDAREALVSSSGPPTEEVLIAVQDGLLKVPAGNPSDWFDVPGQRSRAVRPQLQPRRTS